MNFADGGLAQRLDLVFEEAGANQLHPLLHGAGGDQHLGDVEFVVFELFADHVHAGDQAFVQSLAHRGFLFQGLIDQFLDLGCLSLDDVFSNCL